MRLQIVLHFLIYLCVIQYSNGASVTWYEPLPVETVSSQSQEILAVQTKVFEGYPVSLSWNFSYTSLNIYAVFIKFKDVAVVSGGADLSDTKVLDAFKDRFNFTRISQRLTLVIFNVTTADDGSNGQFKCELVTAQGSWNRKIQVTIVAPSRITSHSDNQTETEGSNLRLGCNATGKPSPDITWTRVLEDGTNSKVLFAGNLWIIENINRTFTGTYRCTADNGIGSPINHTIFVNVHYAAKINYTSGNQTLNESDTFHPICVADGNPTPNITWTRVSDNKLVSFPFNITGKQDEGGYKCTASNGEGEPDSRIDYVIVQNFHPVNTRATTNLTDNTVTVNETFSITCSAQANPPAKYLFYKGNEYVNGPDNNAVIATSVSERVKMVNYSCIPFNFYGNGTKSMVAVTVYYAPGSTKLISVPSNTTVLRESLLRLTCQVDSNPEAEFHFYFNGILIETNSAGILTETVTSDGVYTCVPNNTAGVGKNASVIITAVEAPSVSVLPQAPTIVDGNSLNLTCNTSGKPKPSIKWTVFDSPKILSTDSRLTVNVSRWVAKNNMIYYQCTASNGVGTPATATVSITVNYLEMTNKPENKTALVKIGQKVDLPCSGEGYPKPTITLTAIYINGSYLHHSSGDSKLSIKADSPFWFRCTVENNSTKLTKWFHLVLNVMKFETAITVVNKDCSNPGEIIKQLRELMTNILKESNIPIENVESITFRCGSVTVYFSLIFSQNIEMEKILTVLKKAAEEKRFGNLQVDPKSIQAIAPERIPTTPTPTLTPVHPTEPKCKDGIIPERNCPLSVLFIVFLVVVAVVLFSVTFAIIIYCLYKRRKCRKDSRVHSSQSEERPFSPSNEKDYSQVNSRYAETGPRSIERANLDHNQEEEGAAATPDYAVVDKSKKKGKKKDKKAAEMKPTEDQFAVVDKSKKKTKLKNGPDATYAEVDWQKKSKKKPMPGEVLYADLGEFHQMKKMPEVSTSPKALPPIKRPEAYAETQYADITQFLKGNPEDPGAELPKDGGTPAVRNTATGSKEESSAGNTGDGAEAANETGF